MNVKKIVNDLVDENTYLIFSEDKVIIVDPGSNFDEIKKAIDKQHIKHVYLYLTHAHYDHIVSANQLQKEYQAPIFVHEDELNLAQDPNLNGSVNFNYEIMLDDVTTFKDELKIPGFDLKVYHVPGHTKGHSMLQVPKLNALFTGDFIFKGDIGRTDFPTGNFKDMQKSLRKLMKLNPNLIIYPGHYDNSSIKDELAKNPYIKELR